MPSPFPGMDPYLEEHWRDVHAALIIYARDALQGVLPGSLRARVEERVLLETPVGFADHPLFPDVRVVEYRPELKRGLETRPEGSIALAEPLVVDAELEKIKHADADDGRMLRFGKVDAYADGVLRGILIACFSACSCGNPALLPSDCNDRYDRGKRQKSGLAGGKYDQDTVWDDRRRLLSFIEWCGLLQLTSCACPGHAGRDHKDRIADLRRQELRCSRTL